MPDGVRAELEFSSQPGHLFGVRLSPVALRDYLAFRRDWSAPGSLDEFEASVDRFAVVADASCSCGEPLPAHDVNAVRALASLWIERVMEVEPPLPVASSAPTPSRGPSTSTASRSSRRRS